MHLAGSFFAIARAKDSTLKYSTRCECMSRCFDCHGPFLCCLGILIHCVCVCVRERELVVRGM